MGQWGLYLLTMWEVAPEVVSTTMAEALTWDKTGYDCTGVHCTLYFTLYDAITAEMAAVVVVSVTLVASCKDSRFSDVKLHKYEKGGYAVSRVTNNLENTSNVSSNSYDADTQKCFNNTWMFNRDVGLKTKRESLSTDTSRLDIIYSVPRTNLCLL